MIQFNCYGATLEDFPSGTGEAVRIRRPRIGAKPRGETPLFISILLSLPTGIISPHCGETLTQPERSCLAAISKHRAFRVLMPASLASCVNAMLELEVQPATEGARNRPIDPPGESFRNLSELMGRTQELFDDIPWATESSEGRREDPDLHDRRVPPDAYLTPYRRVQTTTIASDVRSYREGKGGGA